MSRTQQKIHLLMPARPCAYFPQIVVLLSCFACSNSLRMYNKCHFFRRKGVDFLTQLPLKGKGLMSVFRI